MSSSRFGESADVLLKIAKARDAIRQKYKSLRVDQQAYQQAMSDTFKPIVYPLEKLVDASNIAIKKERNEDVKIEHETKPYVRIKKRPRLSTSTPIRKSYSTGYNDSESNYETPYDDDNDTIDDADFNNTADETVLEQTLREKDDDTSSLAGAYTNLLRQQKDNDTTYGVRLLSDNKSMMIGDSSISFSGSLANVRGSDYLLTEGLLELLIKRKANSDLIKPNDLENYKKILESTNAHRKGWAADKPIHANTSNKYQLFIKNLFHPSVKLGGGLPKYMETARKKRKIDYVYWDDPNELVDRLWLLSASRAAGNPSHSNEIMAIVEELREAGIVY